MKNKYVIVVVILLLNIAACFMVGKTAVQTSSDYKKALNSARTYMEKGLCSKAVRQYELVLQKEDTLALREERIQAYTKGIENGEFSDEDWISEQYYSIVDTFREETKAYEAALNYFQSKELWEDCVTVLRMAEHRKVDSENITEIREKVRYQFALASVSYDEIGPFSGGTYTVNMDGKKAYINTQAIQVLDDNYEYASPFSEGFSLVKANGYTYLINTSGERESYFSEDIISTSGVGDGLLSCYDGTSYKYYAIDGTYQFGDYLFAGRFCNGIAAVMEKEGEWRLINTEGEFLSETIYEDIKLNEVSECAANGIILLKMNEKYKMYDLEMKQIGKEEFDDILPFVTQEAVAFLKNDKWGFVSIMGEIEIKPEFEAAKSFSNGYAAVKEGEDWAMINQEGKIVIQDKFNDIGYMNENGICFVKKEEVWTYLRMYY